MNVVSVVGARPQFVKAAAVSRELRKQHREILVHTGQHYDPGMSDVFFRELGIPDPDINLGVGSGSHGAQTGTMLTGIEKVLQDVAPDMVLVYGDTNSTLAGAMAAAKLHIPVAHVEAGLRSFNRRMPEEINRVVVDHISDLLLCPSRKAADHLRSEGIVKGVHVVGDVMADVLLWAREKVNRRPGTLLDELQVAPGHYVLATVHRAENTDDPARLSSIMDALENLEEAVVFPVHPRTRKALDALGWRADGDAGRSVCLIEPLGYLDMVRLMQSARLILTDSGGMQKEAYWLGVPCVILREETEWTETVDAGWNILTGADRTKIEECARTLVPPSAHPSLYGDGHTAAAICEVLTGQWPEPGKNA